MLACYPAFVPFLPCWPVTPVLPWTIIHSFNLVNQSDHCKICRIRSQNCCVTVSIPTRINAPRHFHKILLSGSWFFSFPFSALNSLHIYDLTNFPIYLVFNVLNFMKLLVWKEWVSTFFLPLPLCPTSSPPTYLYPSINLSLSPLHLSLLLSLYHTM